MDKKKIYAAAISYAFIIGLSFMFVKLALRFTSPIDTLAHRFTLSFAAMLLFNRFKSISCTLSFREIVGVLPLAIIYPVCFFGFQALGLSSIASSEAGIIQAATPIFTMMLASVFLKEKMTLPQNFFLLLSVAGVVYIMMMKGSSYQAASILGTVYILLSALSLSGYSVLARKMTQNHNLGRMTYIMNLTGFLLFNLMALTNHAVQGSFASFLTPFRSPLFVCSLFYLGVLSSFLSSYLSNFALSGLEASKMSVFGNLATLITMLAGVVFLGEKLRSYHVVGAALILIGVIGINMYGGKKARS